MSGVNSISDSNFRNEFLESLLFQWISCDQKTGEVSMFLEEEYFLIWMMDSQVSHFNDKLVWITIRNSYDIYEEWNLRTNTEIKKLQYFSDILKRLDNNFITLNNNKAVSIQLSSEELRNSIKLKLVFNFTQKVDSNRWGKLENKIDITDDEKIELIDAIMKALESIEKESMSENTETVVNEGKKNMNWSLQRSGWGHWASAG